MKQRTSNFVALISLFCTLPFTGHAQTGADFMTAMKKADCVVAFDVNDTGKEYKVNWGMDTAWDWDYNVNLGIAHVGVGNFAYGRISFQPTDLVGDDLQLSTKQINALRSRIRHITSTGVTDVLLNNDVPGDQIESYRANYKGNPQAYYRVIKATVMKAKELGVNVVAIAPLNEPDYIYNEQGTQADFLAIAKLIKEDSYFNGIRVCGGNTLDCNNATEWYNYLFNYLDEGNTHQLSGEFYNYADFFAKVKNDGKVATADELHNVGEAIVGVNYGMENGIWWAFDSKARGQFCIDSNQGVRIGYGENRNAWTNAAVYRNETTGEVHGYFGSSERQAKASSFQYISTTKDVYFNGYGPTRAFVYSVPAYTDGYSYGKSFNKYQYGQINAERLFDVTWGEDVAPAEINGTYRILNAFSRKMVTMNGAGSASSFIQSASYNSKGTSQQWTVTPVYTDFIGEVKTNSEGKNYISFGEGVTGDVSYWFIDNAGTSAGHWNVLNNNLKAGASVICFNAGHGMNEQWYLKYAKDGYYFIISRLSNKYLYCSSSTSGTALSLQDAPAENITENNLKKYLWRFQPTDTKADLTAPVAPTNLVARQRVGSIQLSWSEPNETDPLTYTVLRKENGEWNTIGRNISGSTFIDNTVVAGRQYSYKMKAVDPAGNRSVDSEIIDAAPLQENALLCQLQFDESLDDQSYNALKASAYPKDNYIKVINTFKSGTAALNLSSQNTYVQIPYSLTHLPAMTIAAWVRWSGGGNWQRVFDFGNGEDSYMFLTPSTGSELRFVMKNGGEEEILTSTKIPTSSYKHIAVTIEPAAGGKTSVTLYVDGVAKATKDDFTISPADIAASVAYIGRSMFVGDPLFKGYIDDFRIYNYALAAEQVAAIMNDTGATSVDVTNSYVDTVPTGISTPQSDGSEGIDTPTYNTAGMQVPSDTRGVVVRGKKKYLNW